MSVYDNTGGTSGGLPDDSPYGKDPTLEAQKPSNSESYFALAEDYVKEHIIDPAKAAINGGATKLEQIIETGGGHPGWMDAATDDLGLVRKHDDETDAAADAANIEYAKSDVATSVDAKLKEGQHLVDEVAKKIPDAAQTTDILKYAAIIATVVAGLYALSFVSALIPRKA